MPAFLCLLILKAFASLCDASADPEMARKIVLNAKMRRTGVCGSAEMSFDRLAILHQARRADDRRFAQAGCEVRAEGELQKIKGTVQATASDFGHEFLDKIIAAKLVDGIGEAIDHINQYSSHHTEAVICRKQCGC